MENFIYGGWFNSCGEPMRDTKLTECQRQLDENDWYKKQPENIQKNHTQYTKKHNISKGEDGYNYCETCKEKSSTDANLWSKPEEYWRLEEIRIRCLEYEEYEVEKVTPLRKNQKITDEALLEKFNKLKGKYIEVSKLKIILGKSHEYPEGFIKVNEPSGDSKMTTVISSTYLKRLSRITTKVWHQKRAFGENEELLVKFTEGPEDFVPQTKKVKVDYAVKILQAREALDSQYERLYDGYGTGPDFKEEEGRLKKLAKILEEAEPLLREAEDDD
jgi:hypothetical protein